MHFTVERHRLLALADGERLCAEGPHQRKGKVLVWACAARVFLKINSTVAGEDALVLRDGGCQMLLRTCWTCSSFTGGNPTPLQS